MPEAMIHSRLGSSSAERWQHCPGSATEAPVENKETNASKKGVEDHAIAHNVLLGRVVEFPSEERKQSILKFVEFVREHEVSYITPPLLETRLECNIVPDHGGTLDCLFVTDAFLHVIDFKSGRDPVVATENRQLMSYLSLARQAFPGRVAFIGTIVQPLVNGPQSVGFDNDDLNKFMVDTMEAENSDDLCAGQWCKWCPLRNTCEVNRKRLFQIAKRDFEKSQEWTVEDCEDILAAAKVIAKMAEDAKTRRLDLAVQGAPIPGKKLVQGRTDRMWIDIDAAATDLMQAGMNYEQMYAEPKMVSPAQAEKVVGKPVVAKLSERKIKGLALVALSSTLPVFVPGSVQEFPEVEIEEDA